MSDQERIVIYVEPELKERVYSTLKAQQLNMKEWFVREATNLCDEHESPSLPISISQPVTHKKKKISI